MTAILTARIEPPQPRSLSFCHALAAADAVAGRRGSPGPGACHVAAARADQFHRRRGAVVRMDHTQEHGGLGRSILSPCRVKSAESERRDATHAPNVASSPSLSRHCPPRCSPPPPRPPRALPASSQTPDTLPATLKHACPSSQAHILRHFDPRYHPTPTQPRPKPHPLRLLFAPVISFASLVPRRSLRSRRLLRLPFASLRLPFATPSPPPRLRT